MDGVDAGCLRFAVRLTPPHARLASGCWPSSAGWDWLPTRLQRKVSEVVITSHPPFPSFSLAQAGSPGRLPTPAPTDPDLPDSGIRLVRSRIGYARRVPSAGKRKRMEPKVHTKAHPAPTTVQVP